MMPAAPVLTLRWSTSKGSYRARFWLTNKDLKVTKGQVYVDGVARKFVSDVVVQKWKKARERGTKREKWERKFAREASVESQLI